MYRCRANFNMKPVTLSFPNRLRLYRALLLQREAFYL